MKQLCRVGFFVLAAYAGIGGLTNQAGAQVAEASLPDNPSPVGASPAGAFPVGASPAGASLAGASWIDGWPAPSGEGAKDPERQIPASPTEREATWKTLPGNFLQDQKDIWMFPVRLAHGHYWVPTLVVAGFTAGLIYADPHAMPYFRQHATNWDDFNDAFDAYITTGEVITLPAALMASGYIRHDQRTVSSALQ